MGCCGLRSRDQAGQRLQAGDLAGGEDGGGRSYGATAPQRSQVVLPGWADSGRVTPASPLRLPSQNSARLASPGHASPPRALRPTALNTCLRHDGNLTLGAALWPLVRPRALDTLHVSTTYLPTPQLALSALAWLAGEVGVLPVRRLELHGVHLSPSTVRASLHLCSGLRELVLIHVRVRDACLPALTRALRSMWVVRLHEPVAMSSVMKRALFCECWSGYKDSGQDSSKHVVTFIRKWEAHMPMGAPALASPSSESPQTDRRLARMLRQPPCQQCRTRRHQGQAVVAGLRSADAVSWSMPPEEPEDISGIPEDLASTRIRRQNAFRRRKRSRAMPSHTQSGNREQH